MNARRLVCVAMVLGAAAAAFGQEVKYEKYQLPNGMTVILHEDHSLPVVAINTWYKVGSKDEVARRSGFAHLFEHLMFMGTRRVPGNAFDVIMEEGGGSNNATTSEDRTNYFSSGPASLLPTLLWLDADRLEELGRTMDQDKLNKQRDVVRNERRQSYENRPYGKSELAIQEMLYPVGHPYHIPTIGTHEDLEAATVTDVKDFFATYYVPNNATLVVAGDFDPAKIKPLIAALFGSIPRGGEAPHRTAPPAKLEGVKRATMLDNVQIPRVSMAWLSPAKFAAGDAELDLLADVLADGKSSRLYKRLVYDDKLAVDVDATQASSLLGSSFQIDVLAAPGVEPERIEKAVDEEIARLGRDGVTAEELERCKAKVELGMLSRLQSVLMRADALNEYEFYFGEPNSFKRDLDRYRNATAAAVQKQAKETLKPDARVMVRVLPEAPEPVASAREKRPSDLAPHAFEPPAPETFELANGLKVMLWKKSELPLVAMKLVVNPGGRLQPNEKAGLADLMATMLGEGAGELDALAFENAVQALGATFDASAEIESLGVSMTTLKRNFPKAAALFADAVLRPRFDPKEWERVQRLHLEELKEQEDQPRMVAERVAARQLFGDGHPFGWPVDGTPETVSKLTLADVQSEYKSLMQPGSATLLVAGDVTADEVKKAFDGTLGKWPKGSGAAADATAAALPARDKLSVVIVDRPEAVQTVVYFIAPGPKMTDPGRVKYELLNTLLGGSFTSRLNQNLREAHGYTYGARSGYSMGVRDGYFSAAASVRADVTGAAVAEFLKEFKQLRGGDVSAAEAGKSAQTLRTNAVQSFEGLGGVLDEASDRLVAGLPFESLGADMKAMAAVSASDLNQMAKGALPLERGVLVLVGDKAAILEQIKSLDLPKAIEVSSRGDVITEGAK